MPIIHATTDSCRLLIARRSRRIGPACRLIGFGDTDRKFVVFRGEVYPQQPVFWTAAHYLSSRLLRELGLIRDVTPVPRSEFIL